MSTSLTHHGAASFEIVGARYRLVIDPFAKYPPATVVEFTTTVLHAMEFRV